VLFGVFWFLMTLVPLIAVPEVPIHPGGVFFIGAAVVAFAIPALLMRGQWQAAIETAADRRGASEMPGAILFGFFLAQALTLSFVVVNLHLQGFSVVEFITSPIATANRYLRARYDGLVSANIFSQSGIVLNYVAVTVGGLTIARVQRRLLQVAILLAAFSPSLVYMQVYADKGTLFLAAAYFFGALIVSRVSSGDVRLITRNTLLTIVASLVVLVPALVLTMAARDGSPHGPSEMSDKILFYLRSYAFGHIYAFSDWFSHYFFDQSVMEYTDPERQTWGFWSAMAIGEVIWPEYVLPDGYFREYFAYGGSIQTNIYTMFRGAIYDFGLVGSLIAMSIFGLAGSFAYLVMLRHRSPVVSQAFFIFLVGFLYTSFVFSLLTWASVYVTAVVVTVVLLFERALNERIRHSWL